jgi:hypothetical protein
MQGDLALYLFQTRALPSVAPEPGAQFGFREELATLQSCEVAVVGVRRRAGGWEVERVCVQAGDVPFAWSQGRSGRVEGLAEDAVAKSGSSRLRRGRAG